MSNTLQQRRAPTSSLPDTDTRPLQPLSTPEYPADISPAVPSSVIRNLVGFTAAMITAPLSSYFLVLKMSGSTTWSGALAALVANVVLIGYIVVAYQEDVAERDGSRGVVGMEKTRVLGEEKKGQ